MKADLQLWLRFWQGHKGQHRSAEGLQERQTWETESEKKGRQVVTHGKHLGLYLGRHWDGFGQEFYHHLPVDCREQGWEQRPMRRLLGHAGVRTDWKIS